MSEELHELHEHAEEAHHDPGLAPVTITMAILAVLVAAVSLLGHRAHTEELLNQSRASDHWAEYQAKNIRRHTYELFLDLMSIMDLKDSPQVAKVKGSTATRSNATTIRSRKSSPRPATTRRKWRSSNARPTASTWARCCSKPGW